MDNRQMGTAFLGLSDAKCEGGAVWSGLALFTTDRARHSDDQQLPQEPEIR